MIQLRLIAFTDKGFSLAGKLAEAFHGDAVRCAKENSLSDWTKAAFQAADAMIYVGAAGIAVRAIAPHLKSKATDPAVIVVDECGQFVIPILSGHLGGANDLARSIAVFLGAHAVITTATDVNGLFAVDAWARSQGCCVAEVSRIKRISARLLAGETISIASDWPISGKPPKQIECSGMENCDVALSLYKTPSTCLHLIPKIAVVGIGCKKGTSAAAISRAYDALLSDNGLFPQAVCAVCSIDLKQNEAGLVQFCQEHSLPFQTYSAAQLETVRCEVSSSDFVKTITGTDNVCERSALLGSGGALLIRKTILNGITFAIALKPFHPDWRQQVE